MTGLSALSITQLQELFRPRTKPKEPRPSIFAKPDATVVTPKRKPLLKPRTIRAEPEVDRIERETAEQAKAEGLARSISPLGAAVTGLAKLQMGAGKETREQLQRGEYGKAALNTAMNVLPDGGLEVLKVGGATLGAMKGLKKAAGLIGDAAPSPRPGFFNPLGSRKKIPEGTQYTAPLDDGTDPRILNTSKLNLSQDAEDRLRKILPPEGEKTVITHEAQQALAREWETVPDELKKALPQDWSPAQHLAAANIVSENMERIVTLSPKVMDFSIPLAEREAAQTEINRLTHDVTEFTGGIAKSREAGGRRLNAFKILANRSMEPSTWLVQAERAKGVPLNTEEMAAIHGFTKENDRAGLVKYVSDLYTPDPRDQVLGLWKAGLLTNPVTHIVNTVGNASMTAMETIKEPVALAADRLISLVRNERDATGALRHTKALSVKGLITDPIKSVPGGLKQGRTEFMRVLKGEPNLAEKYDFRNTNYDNWFGGPIWNGYTRTVFGSLAASDRVFRAMGVARALEEHIRLQVPIIAKSRGLDKDAIPGLVDELRKAPTDDLMLRAIEDAEYATFQNKNKAADAVSAFKGKLGPTGKAVADFAAPFIRTPANVTARLIDYSPLGLVRAFKIGAKELSIPDQKKLAENLGRSVTGSSLVMLGFMLAREGKATGAAPGAPGGEGTSERAMWEEQNKQANSVKVGDKWVNFSRISPPGMLVALGAQMYHAAEGAESVVGKAVGAVASVGRVAADQPFLTGPSGMLNVLNDPSRYAENFAERTVGSLVPAGVAAVARGLDDTVRQPEGIAETVASRIPGLSDNVGARVTPFGEDVKREGGLAGALLNPAPYRTENDDPLLAEMERLGLAPKFAGKTFKSGGLTVKRSPEEQREFQRIYGWYQKRNLGRALNAPSLTADEDKQKEAERAQSAAYRSARNNTRPRLNGSQQFVKVGKKKR